MLVNLVYIAIGGAIGACLRYLTTIGLSRLVGSGFPWGTMAANVVGSMAMGMLVGWLMRRGGDGETLRLFVGVGLLGGFTTFSTFSLEVMLLWQRGDVGSAITYAAASVFLSVLGLIAGLVLMRGTA